MPEGLRFKGFRSPNYTQVPDELFDELLALLTFGELKVLLYVMRRTFGFKKGSDRISKSQLENGIVKKATGEVLDLGTGLSRRAIRLAVQRLVAMNILLKRTHRSREKGDESTEYALNIIGHDPWVLGTPGGGSPRTHGGGNQVPPQDTVDKKQSYTRVRFPQKEGTTTPHMALVTYFHWKAGHPESQPSTPKELKQAKDLLTKHGEDTSKALVNFAFERAAETQFRMEHFGAVLTYVSRGLASLATAEARHRAEEDTKRKRVEEDCRIDHYKAARERLQADSGFQLRLKERIAEARRTHLGELQPWHIGAVREDFIREELRHDPDAAEA